MEQAIILRDFRQIVQPIQGAARRTGVLTPVQKLLKSASPDKFWLRVRVVSIEDDPQSDESMRFVNGVRGSFLLRAIEGKPGRDGLL